MNTNDEACKMNSNWTLQSAASAHCVTHQTEITYTVQHMNIQCSITESVNCIDEN